jgi:photosystem II stability/assembly factor-like uncharacterized protein
MRNPRLLLLAICLIGLVAGRAESKDAIYGVASRGTTAVAVADSGRILQSPQAPHVAWFGTDRATLAAMRAVSIGANDYVAVGMEGKLLRSADATGLRWLPRSSRTSLDLYGVHNTSTRLVAVGDSGVITISTSLTSDNWTVVANRPTHKPLRAVTAGPTFAVAVGDSGSIIWAPANLATTWYPADVIPTVENLRGVGIGPGASPRFWAVGDGGVIVRSIPNAREWEQLTSPVTTRLNAVTFDGMIGIAVGDGGTVLYSNGGEIWAKIEVPTALDLFAVAHTGSGAGGGFVAVGDENMILWSAVGLTWEQKPVPIKTTSWGSVRGAWGSGRSGR